MFARRYNAVSQGSATCNLLTNIDLNGGWSQSYNTDIVFGEIDPPEEVTDLGAAVVGFRDIDTDGGGYWYSYGDFARVRGAPLPFSLSAIPIRTFHPCVDASVSIPDP